MKAKHKLQFVGVLIFLGFSIFVFSSEPTSDIAQHEVRGVTTQNDKTSKQTIEKLEPEVPRKYKTLKKFSSSQFKYAYDHLSHPNIQPIVESPFITGNATTDKEIIRIAEKRGYTLRMVSTGGMQPYENVELQYLILKDWQDMVEAAQSEGIAMYIVSGYRSIEDQRELFLGRLSGAGLSNEMIATGQYSAELDAILSQVAPPGYSRHHSGYTIDVGDPNFSVFASSTAYAWLAQDNFKNAKRFGFIPGYPAGAGNQGPNPEPWEFVWVSKDVTYED